MNRTRFQREFEKWGVRASAILTFLMGLVNLISAVLPTLAGRLALVEKVFPVEVRHGTRITAALAGFGLLLLAGSLGRRKRAAWLVTMALLAVSAVSHLVKGLDYEAAAPLLGLLALLLLLRRSFHAESDRPSVRQGLLVLAAALAFTLVYGALGFYLLDRHFSVKFGLPDALIQTVVMFTAFYNPGLQPLTGFGRYFADSIYIIGFTTLGFAALMLIRPVLVRQPATAEERRRAEEIVRQYGRTALARATLFDDKSYFFHGRTVIAYGASGRGALALGDPIGPPEEAAEAIAAFRDFCSKKDWTPAFASVLPDYLDAYRAAGFDTLCIGYEAIVDLAGFTLEGSQNKELRNSVSRLERRGYKAEIHLPPLDVGLLDALRPVSDAWLTLRRGGELHFSDGWFDEDYLRGGPVMVVTDADGRPAAFANLVPEYAKNELTLDLMRHYPQPENGLMEYLFVRMLQAAQAQGCQSFSLGLSALVGVGERPDDPRVEKALKAITDALGRFYNFKGLHRFKEKFHPHWQPRYLAYPGPLSLPTVVNTLLAVHSGRDFWVKWVRRE